MSTPCNSLNVQLIKVSQLSSYSSIKDADQLMIVENTGGSKYSRQSQLSDVRGYILDSGLSGFPSGISYDTATDSNTINFYGTGKFYTFSHSLGSKPALVRVVLLCNSNDGSFLNNDEIDISNCMNGNYRQLATVISNSTYVKVSFLSFSDVYVYNPSSTTTLISLNKLNWQIKTYVWK